MVFSEIFNVGLLLNLLLCLYINVLNDARLISWTFFYSLPCLCRFWCTIFIPNECEGSKIVSRVFHV